MKKRKEVSCYGIGRTIYLKKLLNTPKYHIQSIENSKIFAIPCLPAAGSKTVTRIS